MARVYIETTIPSFYYSTRTQVELVAWRMAMRRWWSEFRHSYELVSSPSVVAELRRAPRDRASQALSLLDDVVILEDPPDILAIAEYYIKQKLMPADAQGDAAHVASASYHGIEFLLTWNCKHLANANKVAHLQTLNKRLSLPVPTITTPLMLIPETPR
jgi:hypothetical protein